MSQNTLKVGTEIYNSGDRANAEHFAVITEIVTDKWGTHLHIVPNAESELAPYWIDDCLVSPEYKGHGGTRIVTVEAYRIWRAGQMQLFRASR
jgi:hypothetical protein